MSTRALTLSLATIALFAACSAPAPTPQPTASQSSTPSPTPSAAGAQLTVTGSGSFSGFPEYYGCMVSFLIEPGAGSIDRDATYEDPEFKVERSFSGCAVSGPAVGAPATLAPGTYRIGGATSLISDVSSPGFARPQIMGGSVACSKELTVLTTTLAVSVTVTFSKAGCLLDVTTR
jgi:hypothetical protein